MVTFVEFLDKCIESFEALILFLDILFVLLHKDDVLGCLPYGFDGLFDLFIIEVDCNRHFFVAR